MYAVICTGYTGFLCYNVLYIIWYGMLPFIVHIFMLCFMLMLKLLSVHKYIFRHCCIDIVFNINKNI